MEEMKGLLMGHSHKSQGHCHSLQPTTGTCMLSLVVLTLWCVVPHSLRGAGVGLVQVVGQVVQHTAELWALDSQMHAFSKSVHCSTGGSNSCAGLHRVDGQVPILL
jgi:hypothetical protein